MSADDSSERVVIVTGAGVGIGYGICERFAQSGAHVILNDIDANLAQSAVDSINAAVGANRVTPYPLDTANVDSLRNMVNDIVQRFGRLDIYIANAGISHYGVFLDYEPDAFDRVLAVNLRGSYFGAQAAARAMIDTGNRDGRIVLISSVTGVQAFPNLSAYGMSKAGLIHLARSLAEELGGFGITVNSVCPGATVTERTVKDDPDYDFNWASVSANERAGQVVDIVEAVTFLTSPGARHVTGQTLIVDGGWSNRSPIPGGHPDLPEESSKLR